MPRRPRPLDPESGPLDRFALDLCELRDRMGPTAPTPDRISVKQGIGRSTVYAILNGSRVPTVDVLTALVTSWNGDVEEWVAKRTKLLNQLEVERLLAASRATAPPAQDRELAVPFGVGLLERVELDPHRLASHGGPNTERLAQFTDDLDQLRADSGMSYTQLERRARSLGLKLPRRSAHAMLRGEVKLTWTRIEGFIRAATVGDDVDMIVENWHNRWNALIDNLARNSIYELGF